MTKTRYFLSRIAQAFGINRRNFRRTDAASEMHLLREAEAHLGAMIWEKTENIELLSANYWNLRKLSQEHKIIGAKLAECQERLDRAHEERGNLLNVASEPELKLIARRDTIHQELSALSVRRDEVIAAAKDIRRSYDGLKVKSEVLAGVTGDSRPSAAELAKIDDSLAELKSGFSALKEERLRIGAEIERGDVEIDAIAAQIRQLKKVQYDQAAETFQTISEANQIISVHRAEFGIIETRMNQLHAEIGRHVSRHVPVDPECTAAARGHQKLIDVMRALRNSIELNRKLADE